MKKLEVITMVSQGFNKVSEQLSTIAESLDKIEKLIDSKGAEKSDANDENILIKTDKNISPNEAINRQQAANILNISVKTLDRYRKKGIIPFYQIGGDGGKVSFKYKDIIKIKDQVKEVKQHQNYLSHFIIDLNV